MGGRGREGRKEERRVKRVHTHIPEVGWVRTDVIKSLPPRRNGGRER